MKLTVILGASNEASFDILLADNPFVHKWAKELEWCLDNCDFNQDEAFGGLLTLQEASNKLYSACEVINRYLKNFIDLKSDLLDQNQEYFNYLHLKFEQLSGEFGKPTRLFSIASPELKQAIRDLNFYTHRVEVKQDSSIGFYMSFNKDQYRRMPLGRDDYQYFDFQSPPGTLFLHYAELGKEYVDLFEDNLPITYKNAKNLHYYSGEAFLLFGEYNDIESKLGYKEWLIEQGVDPYNKFEGHGKIPLGKVDNLPQVKEIISNNRHISKILINE
jgi:hypothetical protein